MKEYAAQDGNADCMQTRMPVIYASFPSLAILQLITSSREHLRLLYRSASRLWETILWMVFSILSTCRPYQGIHAIWPWGFWMFAVQSRANNFFDAYRPLDLVRYDLSTLCCLCRSSRCGQRLPDLENHVRRTDEFLVVKPIQGAGRP